MECELIWYFDQYHLASNSWSLLYRNYVWYIPSNLYHSNQLSNVISLLSYKLSHKFSSLSSYFLSHLVLHYHFILKQYDSIKYYYYSYSIQPARLFLNQLLVALYRSELFIYIYEDLSANLAHLKGILDGFRLLICLSHNEYLFLNKVDAQLCNSYLKCL